MLNFLLAKINVFRVATHNIHVQENDTVICKNLVSVIASAHELDVVM